MRFDIVVAKNRRRATPTDGKSRGGGGALGVGDSCCAVALGREGDDRRDRQGRRGHWLDNGRAAFPDDGACRQAGARRVWGHARAGLAGNADDEGRHVRACRIGRLHVATTLISSGWETGHGQKYGGVGSRGRVTPPPPPQIARRRWGSWAWPGPARRIVQAMNGKPCCARRVQDGARSPGPGF